jgi:hypothetical protein
MRIFLRHGILLLTAAALWAETEPQQDKPQRVQLTKTDRLDFATGGTLHLKNSTGVLNIQGWDQPAIEITTIRTSSDAYPAADREKVTNELDRVQIATERSGNELTISTSFPRRGFPLPDFIRGANSFNLEYRIKVPFDTRLVIEHDIGEVNVYHINADIDATLREGGLLLNLPEQETYSIHAQARIGSVHSDFAGMERGRPFPFGHRLAADAGAHKLNLKVGYGDILILKINTPKAPAPLASGQER